MIVDIFISLLSDKIYDKIKDWIDKRSISELIETLKQKTIEFEHKNDGTVIVSSQFANYIEYYNFVKSNGTCIATKYLSSSKVNICRKYD